MKKFALEFKEETQSFKHNYGRWIPETNGYTTIQENMDDWEAMLFQCYINDMAHRTKPPKYTANGLKKSMKNFRIFLSNIVEFDFLIIQHKHLWNK
jgi:hypothetical protein